jgi:hypothetical protein
MATVFVGRCPRCDDHPDGEWSDGSEFEHWCGLTIVAQACYDDNGAVHWRFTKAFTNEPPRRHRRSALWEGTEGPVIPLPQGLPMKTPEELLVEIATYLVDDVNDESIAKAAAAIAARDIQLREPLIARITALRGALVAIEEFETDFAVGVDENMSNVREDARRALEADTRSLQTTEKKL